MTQTRFMMGSAITEDDLRQLRQKLQGIKMNDEIVAIADATTTL